MKQFKEDHNEHDFKLKGWETVLFIYYSLSIHLNDNSKQKSLRQYLETEITYISDWIGTI